MPLPARPRPLPAWGDPLPRLCKALVVALIALLICSMGLAAPAGANVDQCAPPGVDSASALPTNLAQAATGPGEDKYTTATVAPLGSVDIGALGLSVPGTLTIGTLSDAPPSICINSEGQFTGFDNELLRAIADKLGLKINFVGTEFSGLLAQVASRRFDVGSSSITTTDARRRTVGFTNGYDFGYFSLVVPAASPITGFDKLAAGQRIGVVQGTVQESYVIDTPHLEPVKFPDYNTVYASLKTRQIDAWVAPSQQASGTVQAGDPAEIVENTFSLDNFVAWAVARDNQPLIDALNSGLDAIIADGTWSRLYTDWVPRALPPGWKPGSKAAPAPQLPDFNEIATENQAAGSSGAGAAAPKSTLSQLAESFLDWDLYKQAIPDLFKTGLPNTLILTISASVIGLVLGMALAVAGISRARWLRWPARIYTDIFRGLPEVVIILLIGLGVGPVVGGLTGNNPYPLGIAALGLMAAAYVGEIFRSGIQSVEAGQMEAARALGLFVCDIDAAGGGAARRSPGAAGVDEPVHLAVEGVVAGVLPGSGCQPEGVVPSRPRSERADRQPVAVGRGGAVLSGFDCAADASREFHRQPAATGPQARRGRSAYAVHLPGDDLMASSVVRAEPVSLSANDIHSAFGPNAVLRGVDIDVPAGTTAAVIGPSGSGKSTLLRTLNRLYEPDRGDILLDGRSVLKDNPDQLRQRIGMVFQHFNLFPHRSVLDNVTLAPRRLKRLGAEQARELGLAQLDRVGLRHKADVRPGTCRAGSSNASRSPARWQCPRR
jgi:polar amino acid transport system permease protein/polar amino acid transport system substrate-binding protein